MANNAKQNEMERILMALLGGPASIPAQIMKGAHDNIDALISDNENKDFFELQNLVPNTGFSIDDEVPQGVEGTYPNEQAFQQAMMQQASPGRISREEMEAMGVGVPQSLVPQSLGGAAMGYEAKIGAKRGINSILGEFMKELFKK